MNSDSSVSTHDDRLNEVLLAYVEACESGDIPNRAELLAAHPDLRADLQLFFDERDRFERFGAVVRGSGSSDRIPVAPPEAVQGQLGDFKLIREVGRGGMGIVYEAEQISLGRRVALKLLPFASAVDPRQLQRFKNEAAAAAHLRHENIVSVHAVGCERGVHYYAMQFIEGQTLAELIVELRQPSEAHSSKTTAPVAQLTTQRDGKTSRCDWIAGLGKQAALALEHAHQMGVIHRDVKPGNFLLDTRGHLWIADFGLAHIANDVGLTMTGELLGTLRYASPEQTLGRRGVVDHRSDLYSLGVTLYELLTLRPPFDGRDRHELMRQISDAEAPALRSLVPEIPEKLAVIIHKALRKDPADRYATAQEFADDLQRFLDRSPIHARPPGLAEHFWTWTRRHPTVLVAAAITLVVMTASSVLIAALVGSEQERTRLEEHRARLAYRAERVRAEEAESRMQLARRAVDELLNISEEELADRPEMAVLRKRVLRSALAFYQEFLAERRDDPLVHAELQETAHHVERILADLEVLRSATHFFHLSQRSVLEDLQITDEQRPQIEELTAKVGREWMESFKDIGLASPSERARRTLEQARTNDAQLGELLSPAQQLRLRQIALQSEGAAAFRDQEVAQAIGLSPLQREQIRMIEDDAAYGWMRGRKRSSSSNASPPDKVPPLTPNQRILQILTEEQVRKWNELTGEPLKRPPFSFGPRTSWMPHDRRISLPLFFPNDPLIDGVPWPWHTERG